MKSEMRRMVETGILFGIFMCFLTYWGNVERERMEIIRMIAEFDFSPREYAIDEDRYTEEGMGRIDDMNNTPNIKPKEHIPSETAVLKEFSAGKTYLEENKGENAITFFQSENQYLRWFDATDYLSEQVPELNIISSYITKKSNGRARFTMGMASKAEKVYDNYGNFLGNYYSVYVGEQWEGHRANWHWFFVNEELNEILWMDIVEVKYYTLEEWRKMDLYKQSMQEIEEFLRGD